MDWEKLSWTGNSLGKEGAVEEGSGLEARCRTDELGSRVPSSSLHLELLGFRFLPCLAVGMCPQCPLLVPHGSGTVLELALGSGLPSHARTMHIPWDGGSRFATQPWSRNVPTACRDLGLPQLLGFHLQLPGEGRQGWQGVGQPHCSLRKSFWGSGW